MGTWLKFIFWTGAVLGTVGFALHLFFFEVWRVPTDDPLLAASIEPTLSAGDLVLVMRHGSVARGDLVRCADPEAAGRFVVARAIGRSGDHVELDREVVSLDGKRVPSPRACDPAVITVHDPRIDEDVTLDCSQEEFGDVAFSAARASDRPELPTKVTVAPDGWFLVSDNRHVHLDSRDFGDVDPSSCQHVVFRIAGAAGFGDSRRRLSIVW